MAPSNTKCPVCGTVFAVQQSMLGKTGKCMACSTLFRIPDHPRKSSYQGDSTQGVAASSGSPRLHLVEDFETDCVDNESSDGLLEAVQSAGPSHSRPMSHLQYSQHLKKRVAIGKQCPKCMQRIDKRASVCPYCRSRQPAQALAIILGVVLVGGLWMCIKWQSNTPEAREQAAKEAQFGTKSAASTRAEEFVTNLIPTPSTAVFGGVIVKDLDKGHYEVKGWVDHENLFGAHIRTYFTCKLLYEGYERWTCEDIKLE